MNRRSVKLGIAILGALAATVVLLLWLLGTIGPARWPADAVLVPGDVATIEDALRASQPGTTIVLQPQRGAFLGPVTVDVANVTILSARGWARLNASGGEPALTIRADGVVVHGIEVTSESVGIRIESARCMIEEARVLDAPIGVQLHGASDCSLSGLVVEGGQIGIEFTASGGNVFTDVTVREASENGLKAVGSWDNVVRTAVVHDVPIGISLEQRSSENNLRDCRIERASIAGVELRGANDNLLVDCVIRDSRIGVLLDGVTGNEVLRCVIEDVAVGGLVFQQAVQNRATENTIHGSQDAGIHLSQSAENALSYNRIETCIGSGIRLDGSDRNLVTGNRLEKNGLGIDIDRSTEARILRNAVVVLDPSAGGLRLAGGGSSTILDNHICGGAFGVMLSGSSRNTLLRNRIEDQGSVGLSLVDGSDANRAAENRILESPVGLLIAGSDRNEVTNNGIVEHDTGLLLVRSGAGTRIEGNTIEGNRTGLRQADEADVPGIEEFSFGTGEATSPILANNVFVRNDAFDVANESSIPLYAAGNWWAGGATAGDTSRASVSGVVDLEGSAWKGTVAIGAEEDVTEEVLGRVLQFALAGSGFRVIDLIGIGERERVREALRAQDVDFIWWGTPESIVEEEGPSMEPLELVPIPATKGWVAVVPGATAQRLSEPTLSAYAAWLHEAGESLRYAVPRAFGGDGIGVFEETYGMEDDVDSVSRTETLGEAEALLKFGAVQLVVVDHLEETLTLSGFVALEDDLVAFDSVQIIVAARSGLLARFPEIRSLLTSLTDSLTTTAVHDLISRVRLLQREPEDVAREYLVRQGFLTG